MITATEITWMGYFYKYTCSDQCIDLCILQDACHELLNFAPLGIFMHQGCRTQRELSIQPKIQEISVGWNRPLISVWSYWNIGDQLWRWSTLTGRVILFGRTEMSLSIWQNCYPQYCSFVFSLQEQYQNALWCGSGLCNWNVVEFLLNGKCPW